MQPAAAGAVEHIVIINSTHAAPLHVADVLSHLDLHTHHADVRYIFNNSAFEGFAATIHPHHLARLANLSTAIALVEPATHIHKSNPIPQTSYHHRKRQVSLTYETRSNAPWGLQRISTIATSSLPITDDNESALAYTYSFDAPSLGRGADIYIVDTGIYTEHTAFSPPGRAQMVWSYDGNFTDLDGHGTHVSGTAAGQVLGVASDARLFGVKVLDSEGGGSSSNVVAGINYVIQAHDAAKRNASGAFLGSVMSMSLDSGAPVQALNLAVTAAVKAGIHTVVAAGNSAEEACSSSPASAGGDAGPAITVGAIGLDSVRASFSNFGACVDVYAPGINVTSAWIGNPWMIKVLDGTSMATPHVTGIVAYALAQDAELAADPAKMKEFVRGSAGNSSTGLRVASNGVRIEAAQGLVGLERIGEGTKFVWVEGEG
ncbi:hypothetical protein M433DRAFT_65392 [Acidomyces richmondensis BFW]|nr:MAG: hypothetical protein FE78DRAFT_145693 [Acidomyces sp. 'richmondensis']KYG46323.1 hypothetical protein M433DRAFT_65392 [Acidomyces richmondensis BFW]